ncbi:hypothetical protein HYN48_11095 [Flavobacterium magnum]|uniref:DUF7674 domain-containing protein n=1 Tax=Flavobacterium magnum TaxID=2162713 RepID=A0A2S0RIP2_9FLAO|nr:hypothetical protein [Flavobacterium magnum]AWA30592.1 hypothetical protein HYN48_11095 [Flavobacterium magnum]
MRNQVTTVYKQAERLAEITKHSIISGNVARAKKILAFADRLLIGGNTETRRVIASVYVHSVSSFLEARNCRISNLFPNALRLEYVSQVNTSGV